MENNNRIALFIDLDNFVGFCRDDNLPIDIKGEIAKLSEHGRISLRRSFGDIMKLPMPTDKKMELRQMLQANLVLHEDVPHYNKYKNTADIRLAIEALSVAYTYPDINLFAIIANDRDFMPLFSKLKEIGKTVIGIGSTHETVGDLYVSACDLFYYHEDLCESNSLEGVNDEESLIRLLVDVVNTNIESGRKTLGCIIAPAMRERKPDLDFKGARFANFRGLCDLAEEQGFITTEPSGNDINITCNEKAVSQLLSKRPVNGGNVVDLKAGYERFIQEALNLKAKFPDYETRMKIFQKMDELLGNTKGGLPLRDLSESITSELALGYEQQPSVYKILYTLYRMDSFIAERCDDDSYNPTIVRSIIDHREMEQSLVRRLIKLFKSSRSELSFDHQKWSEVLVGNGSYARTVKFAHNYE